MSKKELLSPKYRAKIPELKSFWLKQARNELLSQEDRSLALDNYLGLLLVELEVALMS